MNIRSIKPKLFEIVEPVVADAGLEVVDISLLREVGGWILRIYLDRSWDPSQQNDEGAPTPDGVSLSDCERISRELSATLDVSDPIPSAYSLEVSSAGIDRPLRTAEHFNRFRGQTAKVRLETGIEGRKNFTGVIIGVGQSDSEPEELELKVDNSVALLPLSDISSAKLVPDWDALLGNSKTSSKTSNKTSKSGSSKQSSKPERQRHCAK